LTKLEKLFALTYPQCIVATYGYSQTCHVWKVSRLSSEWVWALYIHAAYTTSSWPAAVILFVELWWFWWHGAIW